MAHPEAGDELDETMSEAASKAHTARVRPQGDEVQYLSASSALPEGIDVATDALTMVAGCRVDRRGCPHCDAKDVRPWGRAHGLPRYRCVECRRTFNALSGTSLARLRHKDRWLDQARALMTGESVAEAARRCGVAYTTAFRWRHRFLVAPARDKPTRLNGIVEADERLFSNPSRAGEPICHGPRERGAESRPRPACRRSRSRFSLRAIVPARPLMPSYPNSTGPL